MEKARECPSLESMHSSLQLALVPQELPLARRELGLALPLARRELGLALPLALDRVHAETLSAALAVGVKAEECCSSLLLWLHLNEATRWEGLAIDAHEGRVNACKLRVNCV